MQNLETTKYLPVTMGSTGMRDIFTEEQELYLDPAHKKLGGVCAGVANYLDVERLYVRIAAIIALLIFPQATLLAYGIAYLVLDEPPADYDELIRDEPYEE